MFCCCHLKVAGGSVRNCQHGPLGGVQRSAPSLSKLANIDCRIRVKCIFTLIFENIRFAFKISIKSLVTQGYPAKCAADDSPRHHIGVIHVVSTVAVTAALTISLRLCLGEVGTTRSSQYD